MKKQNLKSLVVQPSRVRGGGLHNCRILIITQNIWRVSGNYVTVPFGQN